MSLIAYIGIMGCLTYATDSLVRKQPLHFYATAHKITLEAFFHNFLMTTYFFGAAETNFFYYIIQ